MGVFPVGGFFRVRPGRSATSSGPRPFLCGAKTRTGTDCLSTNCRGGMAGLPTGAKGGIFWLRRSKVGWMRQPAAGVGGADGAGKTKGEAAKLPPGASLPFGKRTPIAGAVCRTDISYNAKNFNKEQAFLNRARLLIPVRETALATTETATPAPS